MLSNVRFIPVIGRRIGGTSVRYVSTTLAKALREGLDSHPNLADNTSAGLPDYPPRKPNTILHFGKQGYRYVVEKFGRFERIESPGVFVTLPFIQKIYEVDTRQLVLDVSRQKAYTSDNVAINVAEATEVKIPYAPYPSRKIGSSSLKKFKIIFL